MESKRESFENAAENLSREVKNDILDSVKEDLLVFEIRLTEGSLPFILTEKGVIKGKRIVKNEDLERCVLHLTGNSYHSFQKEIAGGFIPLKNGHRAGIAGTAVYENGVTKGIKNISAVVLRVANDIILEENPLFDDFGKNGLYSAIISGPPCSGKTTFLRDTARRLCEKDLSVVLVDERQEIGKGIRNCTVMRGMDKSEAIIKAVRSLSPNVIICDEVGDEKEALSVTSALNCGSFVITSIHSSCFDDLKNKKAYRILNDTKEFKKAVFLDTFPHIGRVKEVSKLL